MAAGPLELIVRGARGSFPGPGDGQRHYGSCTTCLDVAVGPGHRVLLDCGTGLSSLEAELGPPHDGGERRFDVLLTHFHLDHLLGLPFFGPLYDPRSRFTFHAHRSAGIGAREALERLVAPPWFPVALRDTPSSKQYVDLDDAPFAVGPLTVRHTRLRHPQGITAYRLEGASLSVVFATDHEGGDPEADERLRELGAGADVLVHDAQYTPEEYEHAHRGWGHSSWMHAVRSARALEVKRLVLFHHDPRRTDDEIDRIVAQARSHFPAVDAAREGTRL